MALVKKLQTGSTIDQNLNDLINQELGNYNLRSKDERKVRDYLVQIRDYMANPEGKSFSVDPVGKSFTISGPGSEKFQGSPDDIKNLWLSGKLKIKDDQDAMSVAASIYGNAIGRSNKTTGTNTGATGTAKELDINNLDNYILSKYGTPGALQWEFSQLDSDDKRKSKVFELGQGLINDYRKLIAENPNQYKAKDIDKINAIEQAIKNKDWDAFNRSSFEMKWEPFKYLLSDQDKERLKAQQVEQTAKSADEMFGKIGVTNPDLKKQLTDLGYTQLADPNWTPDQGATWWSDVLKKNKANVLYNPTTKKHIVLKGNELFNHGMDDQFAPGYGFSWRNDAEGFHWYSPGQYAQNSGVWKPDQYASQNIGRELITNLPGAKVYGWSEEKDGKFNKDVLGRRDFTKNLQVEQNGRNYKLTRGEDNIYRDQQGRVVNLKITGFGNTHRQISVVDPDILFPHIKDAKPWGAANYDAIVNSIASNLKSGYEISDQDLGYLKYGLKHDESLKANKVLTDKVRNLLAEIELNLQKQEQQTQQVPVNKFGGIIKAQGGTALQILQSQAKSKTPNESLQTLNAKVGSGTTLHNLTTGPLNRNEVLSTISTAGDIAAFIPGWGAIGGAVSTVADAIKGANDADGWTWGDTGTLAANLAFTGLAFFGAGWLKSALKVGKVAKEAKVGVDLGKIAKIAEKEAARVGGTEIIESAKNIGKLGEVLGKGEKVTAKTLGETFEKLSKGKGEEIAKQFGVDASEEGQKLLAKTLQADFKTVSETTKTFGIGKNLRVKDPTEKLKSLGEKLIENPNTGKWVKRAMIAPVAAGGISSGINIGSKLFSGEGKAGDITVDEIGSLAQLGLVGRNSIKGFLANKAIVNQTYLKGKDKGFEILINNQPAKLRSSLEVDKISKELNWKKFWKGKQPTQESVKDYNSKMQQKIADAYNKENGTSIKPEEITITDPSKPMQLSAFEVKGTERLLHEKPQIRESQTAISARKEWNRAHEALSGGLYRPFPGKRKPIDVKTITQQEIAELNKSTEAKNIEEAKKVAEQVIPSKKPAKSAKPAAPAKKKAKPAPAKPDVPKRKKKLTLEQLKAKSAESASLKKGGIIKAENGIDLKKYTIVGGNKLDLSHKPINEGNLFYGNIDKSGNDWRFDKSGKYTNEYLSAVEAITPEEFEEMKPLIQEAVTKSGSSFKLENLDQFKKLATDYKPGVIHDLSIVKRPTMPLIEGKPQGLPVAKINTPQIDISKLTGIPTTSTPGSTTTTGKKVDPNPKSKFNWRGLMPDATDIANIAMFANTWAGNRKAGNEQRRAIAESMYSIPYLNQQYIRIDSPYALLGQKQAANVRTRARNIAKSTSDIDKSLAVRLEGEDKAGVIVDKANAMDKQRFDQLRSQQLGANAKVNAANTEILGKNRALAAGAFKGIHLVNANETMAQTTNLNNLITATSKNIPMKEYKQNQRVLFETYDNPKFKKAAEQVQIAQGEEGKKSYYDRWKENYDKTKLAGVAKEWADSDEYKEWQENVKQKQDYLKTFTDNIARIQMAQSLQLPLLGLKSGGTLSKSEKLEIEREKSEYRRRLKETELAYKAIMHNNEMLQKALIKVFK